MKKNYRRNRMDKHSKNSLFIGLPLLFIIHLSHFAHAANFDVKVPDRGNIIGLQPLRDIELFVDLPTTISGDVKFQVTRTSVGSSRSFDFLVNSIAGTSNDSETKQYVYDEPTASATAPPDQVTISAHPGPGETKRFKIHMQLDTNWSNDSGSCADRQSGVEIWTIATLANDALSAPSITGACINSYELDPPSASCDRSLAPVTDTPATIISSTNISTITLCEDGEPPKPPKPPKPPTNLSR